MNKHKARKIFVYLLLAFVIFLYLFSIAVFLFGDPAQAIYVFAYSTFFTIITYFLFIMQRRLEASAKRKEDDQNPPSHKDND